MTRIFYDRAELRLSMEGHALCGDYGQDIVCAAESMLIMCLERRLMDFEEQLMLKCFRGPGRVQIEARPAEEVEARCRECFDTVFAGFRLLAQYEPEHVSVMETGEDEQ